ncbi:hypothetical protein KWC53_004496 [Salmonella enterica]|nr:hypothetical protein [Salmonella enterica]
MKDVKFSAKKNKFGRILFYVMEDSKHLYEFNKIEDAAEWISELGRRALIK